MLECFLLACGINLVNADPRINRSWEWTTIPAKAAKFPDRPDADDARSAIRNPIVRSALEIIQEKDLSPIIGRVRFQKTPFHVPEGTTWAEHLYSQMSLGPAIQLS